MRVPFAIVSFLAILTTTLAAQAARPQLVSDPLAEMSKGKAIFVSRCTSCHDENGNKTLANGTTLLARLTRSQDPESRLGTRLKDRDERHAVMVYLQSMLNRLSALPFPAKTH